MKIIDSEMAASDKIQKEEIKKRILKRVRFLSPVMRPLIMYIYII